MVQSYTKIFKPINYRGKVWQGESLTGESLASLVNHR